jgi:hypothetical protein
MKMVYGKQHYHQSPCNIWITGSLKALIVSANETNQSLLMTPCPWTIVTPIPLKESEKKEASALNNMLVVRLEMDDG